MAADSLDQLVDSELIPTTDQAIRTEHRAIGSFAREYPTIDVYAKGTLALYTPPARSFGLMSSQPFQYGYNLRGGYEMHFHGPDSTTLTHGHLKFEGRRVRDFTGYECAMFDLSLPNNFRRFR